MKLAIIGAGAMGSLLGFHLAAQAEVWLLTSWQAQADAINAYGISCERDGHEQQRPARAATDPAQIGGCDIVLVVVKAHQTKRAAEAAQLVRRRAPEGFVVTLQNGIGNREILAHLLGAGRVGQGVTTLGATLLGPGRVRQVGNGSTVFGTQPDAAAAHELALLFRVCGLPADVSDDLDALVWSKLVVNAGINALSALLRVPNGALAEVPAARELMAAAVAEAAAVARARGVVLPDVESLGRTLEVARATGTNHSSMLQDILRGSPTEIDAINGAVVRERRRHGIPTPINELLTLLVRAHDDTVLAGWSVQSEANTGSNITS